MQLTRRTLLTTAVGGTLAATSTLHASAAPAPAATPKPTVSIVKIPNGNIDYAVEKALDLLGGIATVTRGKDRILLKPNLVFASPDATTKPPVVRALARLMKAANKDVSIAEGSAAAPPFNVRNGEVFRTTKPELLNAMQQDIFHRLGYDDLAKTLKVPLINLHTGDLATVTVPGAFVFDRLTIHRTLIETDLLCSVPMMKTHTLAGVTLGLKNLIGAYPGSIYQAVRGRMHDTAATVEPSGTASAIIDMVRANKLGLVVVDASTAMEGDGPSNGPLVPMETIIAGANPLATDMVAAHLMGFEPANIPTFTLANQAGMRPERLDEIEIRGEPMQNVARNFLRPHVVPWSVARAVWATREI